MSRLETRFADCARDNRAALVTWGQHDRAANAPGLMAGQIHRTRNLG